MNMWNDDELCKLNENNAHLGALFGGGRDVPLLKGIHSSVYLLLFKTLLKLCQKLSLAVVRG